MPWHDKPTGKNYLKPTQGKCLHYYFYVIDDELGLCYLRVPTWAPFGVQFYCNGHSALARTLRREGLDTFLRTTPSCELPICVNGDLKLTQF